MQNILNLLQKYWQHTAFRPLQENIINAVLHGKDTLAVLPTGGGKSVCFQIPALAKEGICLVISPLVALMKDQVSNLQAKGIKAAAITGGLTENEVGIVLDNCQFGNYKFLYLSPERLQTHWVVERIKLLPVNLLAVDEAHCVSQWGHDFRPAYLQIPLLRTLFPNIPLLALTASVTPKVEVDMVTHLALREPSIFKQSFARKNLAYQVIYTENKLGKIKQLLQKSKAPAIIYVRNRNACIEWAERLQSVGFTATYYHGGLLSKEKEKNMTSWMAEHVQVMVATSAFGMGIDKPNVRTVCHVHLPENLENYYQEAGRAGRDDQNAQAILLVSPGDPQSAVKQVIDALPDKTFVSQVFIKLCNYFGIAYGEGFGEGFAFQFSHFCTRYGLSPMRTYQALQFLDRQAVISFNQESSEKITVQFRIESRALIHYTDIHHADREIILALVRTYPGIYQQRTNINVPLLVNKSGNTETQIVSLLKRLQQEQIISLEMKNQDTFIFFNEVREDQRTINRVAHILTQRNALKKEQFNAVLAYATKQTACKSQTLLAYFGEQLSEPCYHCNYCLSAATPKENQTLKQDIKACLATGDYTSRELLDLLQAEDVALIFALDQMLDHGIVEMKGPKYCLK